MKNRFVVPVECCRLHERWTHQPGTSLGPNTCSKLIKFVTFGWWCLMIMQMSEKKLYDSYFFSPVHIYVHLDSIPFCAWKQNIKTDSALCQKTILDVLLPQRSHEFTILLKISHKGKIALKFISRCALLMVKLDKIWCTIIKHIFCLIILVLKWRQSRFFIVLWWWGTMFCRKRQVGHSIKKVGNHWFSLTTSSLEYLRRQNC